MGSGRFADPSAVTEFYVVVSMLALLTSVICYMIDQLVHRVRDREPFERHVGSPSLQPDQMGTSESITRAPADVMNGDADVMNGDQERRGPGREGSLWGQ
jgi:hypothetical protein